jgi:hypothetical protein
MRAVVRESCRDAGVPDRAAQRRLADREQPAITTTVVGRTCLEHWEDACGHDPRNLARLGVQAAGSRSSEPRPGRPHTTHISLIAGGVPTYPERNSGGPPQKGSHGLSGSDSFSARERLKWEPEHSPSATARVSAARALLDWEPRPDVSEPEAGVPRRGVNLTEMVALAIACGVVDLDELVREASRRAPGLEAGYPALNPEPPEATPKVSCGTRLMISERTPACHAGGRRFESVAPAL